MSTPPPSAFSECASCRKQIVLHPGTDRYRSTEHGIAVDRMKCEKVPGGHHQPSESAESNPRVHPGAGDVT